MTTVSQDNYVMEMQVQQEKWAKQKETYKDRKIVSWRGGKRQNNLNIYSVSIQNMHFKLVGQKWEKEIQLSKNEKPLSFESTAPPITVRRHTASGLLFC